MKFAFQVRLRLNFKMFLKNIPSIAVVLTDDDVKSVIKTDLLDADIIELRVDMFKKINNVEGVFILAKDKYNLPLICTVRSPNEGGKKIIKNRLTIYEKVMPYCSFFDIEIFSNEAAHLKQLTKESNLKLIGSYHNFKNTPSIDELEKVFHRGKSLGLDIIKIATLVNEKEDLEKLLLFTLNHKKDKIIVLGMGEYGIPSRVINPVFGSMITYASLNEPSAPGQITLRELSKIFNILGLRS